MFSEVVQHPKNTTVCQGDSAAFTCVVFISSGIPSLSLPQWVRNGAVVDMVHHTITSNLTAGATTPVNISSTVTVSNVTVSDDDGSLYQCGITSAISSNATLHVVGKCVNRS